MYKRVLLKLSGEQLAGKSEHGIDPTMAAYWASEIGKISKNTQVVIMVGGGNFMRGAHIAGHGIKRVTADHMGMLGTMMNTLALTDIFESKGIKTRSLSAIFANQVAEPFVHRLANKHLQRGRVVIVGGGSGRPYVTTDTAAVILALEMDCDVVIKATKVDGVYDKDPSEFQNAKKISKLTYQKAVQDGAIKVMDKAALGLAMEQKMPTIVYKGSKQGALAGIIAGKTIGTLIN